MIKPLMYIQYVCLSVKDIPLSEGQILYERGVKPIVEHKV